MLDRLISGAGAVTDGADRTVRALAGGSQREIATTRPGSLLVAAVLLLLAGMLVVAGLEATDPSTPVTLGPADVAASTALGDRTYSAIHGALSSTHAEYYSDDNANGTEDEGEETLVWYYWLIDRDARAGVTVRSSVDCVIAACALRHDLTVLHVDRDFTNLARVSHLEARDVKRG